MKSAGKQAEFGKWAPSHSSLVNIHLPDFLFALYAQT